MEKDSTTCWHGWESLWFSYISSGNVKYLAASNKVKHMLILDIINSYLSIYPREMKTYIIQRLAQKCF
jgi:hypothetical protein